VSQAADPSQSVVGLVEFGPGRLGGEAYFVPAGEGGAEDDGYLLTFVHDESTNKTDLAVFDAKSMSSKVSGIIYVL
jgi:carotenoid cleavage dioxygenase-like enzyme